MYVLVGDRDTPIPIMGTFPITNQRQIPLRPTLPESHMAG